MKDVEKIILKVKYTEEITVVLDEEGEFGGFPDNVLDMVDYINHIKSDPEHYVESVHRAEASGGYNLTDIKVIEKD